MNKKFLPRWMKYLYKYFYFKMNKEELHKQSHIHSKHLDSRTRKNLFEKRINLIIMTAYRYISTNIWLHNGQCSSKLIWYQTTQILADKNKIKYKGERDDDLCYMQTYKVKELFEDLYRKEKYWSKGHKCLVTIQFGFTKE